MEDYRRFVDRRAYVFDEIGPQFRKTGRITPTDFYIILGWKSDRAKNKVAERLKKKGEGSFRKAVKEISVSLSRSKDQKQKLKILMKDWGLRLPMATSILTVLYPKEFTIYDIRVCDELDNFRELVAKRFSDKLWASYEEFVAEVNAISLKGNLLDKNNHLWGRSFHKNVAKQVSKLH